MSATKEIAILGAALDLGTTRRGVDMGPSAIRYAGLAERLESLGLKVDDCGNVLAEIPEVATVKHEHARYLPAILATCKQIASRVAEIARQGQMPLVLGGDHSIAMGTLAGLASVHGLGGVLWVDAHGDLNRPQTSPSGNVHGMPLAAALGACGVALEGFEHPPWVDRSRVVVIGARQLDRGEKQLIQDLDLRVLTMSDLDRRGIASAMHEALTIVQGGAFVHVSLDLDVLDPEIAPGVGTPEPGGLSYREAHLAMELIAESGLMTSMEAVEGNPTLDSANVTAEHAVELIGSAMGATIL